MVSSTQHLTKSRFLVGRHCPRRLWLRRHEPELAAAVPDSVHGIREMGDAIGRLARELFPGGRPVLAEPWAHDEAVRHTRELMDDASVPAIFEAAFEFANVRIRVDVLERLDGGRFGLREVKAAARIKETYLEDVAIQEFVLRGCGLEVASAEIVHVNSKYVHVDGPLDLERFFSRVEMREAVSKQRSAISDRVARLLEVVAADSPPAIEPSPHCRVRHLCEFWDHCTADKPDDWVLRMPRLTRKQLTTLNAAGIARISQIPDDFPLQTPQRHMREATLGGGDFVAHGLSKGLRGSGPPAAYLDFETANPAVPLYTGTHPFQVIPFQWSLHRDDGSARLEHLEFLADGAADPRRAFSEALIAALADSGEPILVYSPFESRVLEKLAKELDDLRAPLLAIRARLVDLLPVIRDSVYHVDFNGSFSIKQVAPALDPGFGYGDLDGVAEGGEAASAFHRIAAGSCTREQVAKLRRELLAYCARDTLALVRVHRALLAREARGAA